MRIAVLSTHSYPAHPESYGSEQYWGYLAQELERQGHEVTFFAVEGSLEPQKGDLIPIPQLREGSLSLGKLEKGVYEQHRDVLAVQDLVISFQQANMVAESMYFWERDSGVNVIWSKTGAVGNPPRPPACDYYYGTSPSNAAAENAKRNRKYGTKTVFPLPHGVPLDVYKPANNPARDYYLYHGAPRKDKGIYEILAVARANPQERFVFAWKAHSEGHRKEEEKFLQKIDKVPNAEFHEMGQMGSQLEEKVDLYQNCKALIKCDQINYFESFGLVSVEAMACGAPVITAKHGANPEVVWNGRTGILCGSLADYISAVKQDAPEGINPQDCREWVESRFSLERFASDYVELHHMWRDKNGR